MVRLDGHEQTFTEAQIMRFGTDEMYLWNQAILEVARKDIKAEELAFYLCWLECLWDPEMWERES